MYRSFTMLGAMLAGVASFRMRKYRISTMANHEAGRDPNLLTNVLNDMFAGLAGYITAHLACCDYIYKHRQYVIERTNFEQEVNFDRINFDLASAAAAERKTLVEEDKDKVGLPSLKSRDGRENKLLLEYPFKDFVS